MKTVTYTIPNISCNHCVHTITTEVSDLAGVITFDAPATEDLIVATLTEINYPPVLS
jgi:copper chaperone CopZ